MYLPKDLLHAYLLQNTNINRSIGQRSFQNHFDGAHFSKKYSILSRSNLHSRTRHAVRHFGQPWCIIIRVKRALPGSKVIALEMADWLCGYQFPACRYQYYYSRTQKGFHHSIRIAVHQTNNLFTVSTISFSVFFLSLSPLLSVFAILIIL